MACRSPHARKEEGAPCSFCSSKNRRHPASIAGNHSSRLLNELAWTVRNPEPEGELTDAAADANGMKLNNVSEMRIKREMTDWSAQTSWSDSGKKGLGVEQLQLPHAAVRRLLRTKNNSGSGTGQRRDQQERAVTLRKEITLFG